jgi:hypothetical protein
MTEPGDPSTYTFSDEVSAAREQIIADRFREFNSAHSKRTVD